MKKTKEKAVISPFRGVTKVLCWVLVAWSLLPLLCNGIHGVGVVLPLLTGAVGLWLCRRLPTMTCLKGWKRRMLIGIGVMVCLVAVLAVVLSAVMLTAAATKPPADGTVVVLGSKIYEDRPSRMLGDRLRAAAAYLEKNPEANCVVSGGLGKGETYTEAYVMKKYLTETCGIAEERIACEDVSTDTRENLQYSMQVIEERGWSRRVVVATQIFHQYRAQTWARQAGAEQVGGAPCRTPLHLVLNYWVRECAAICRLWIFGR